MANKMAIDPKIQETWEKLSKGKTEANWMAAEFKKSNKTCSLDFMAEGEGGLQEVCQQLKQCGEKAIFGLIKVKFYDEMAQKKGSPYIKFIYFRFLGSKVGVMTKGFLTPRLGSVDEIFPVKHLSYDIDENLTKFDQKTIAMDFLRVSDNKVEASSFDFGPNQTYYSQNEVVVNNNKKPQNAAPAKKAAQPKKVEKVAKVEKVEQAPPSVDNDAKDNTVQNQDDNYNNNDNNDNNDNNNDNNNNENYDNNNNDNNNDNYNNDNNDNNDNNNNNENYDNNDNNDNNYDNGNDENNNADD